MLVPSCGSANGAPRHVTRWLADKPSEDALSLAGMLPWYQGRHPTKSMWFWQEFFLQGAWVAWGEGTHSAGRDRIKVKVKLTRPKLGVSAGQELCSPRRWTRAAQLPSDSVWNLMVFVSHVFQINQFSFLCFRGVFSMVILKMTETQAGEYRLLIQSAATNYTVLFTVSIRSKCHLLLGFLNILKGWLESKSSY